MGVERVLLYGPRAEYLTPPLQGYRLRDGAYRRLPAVTVRSNRGVAVASEVLGLEFRDEREARMVRLRDSATGDDLLSYREEAGARQAAEACTAALEARIREPEDALAATPKSNEP